MAFSGEDGIFPARRLRLWMGDNGGATMAIS